MFFFFKQKTAYEMRISDWSSDVCSSDLNDGAQCVVDRSDAAGTSRNGQSAWHNRGKRAPMDHQQLFLGIGHRIVILRITLRPLRPQAGVVGHARTLSPFHAVLRAGAKFSDDARGDRKSTRLNSSH